ncbi:hypothetical protein ACFTAO_38200 [Paenibacillus rhizoplanae]
MISYLLFRRWKKGPVQQRRGSQPSQPSHRARRVYLVVLLVAIIGGGSLSAYSIDSARGITNELVQAESAGFLNYEVVAAIKAQEDSGLIGTGDIAETIAKVQALEATYPYKDIAGGLPEHFGSQKGKKM